jgi:CheY-like chemotaxis protein
MGHNRRPEDPLAEVCAAAHLDGGSVRPRPTVLLVDDDPAILDGLSEFLTEEGFVVVTAAEGREALSLLTSGVTPAAIILDVMMPPMDGWDFRQHQLIDARFAHIPTIIISASGFSRGSIKAQFGDVEFIPKPIALPTLLKTLRAATAAASPSIPAGPTGEPILEEAD